MHTALSNDESNHKNGSNFRQGCYVIIKEEWHSDEFIIWLHMMDLLACGEKWRGHFVASIGNSRHLHIYSTHSKPGEAIQGLPANCYNHNWLKSLNSLDCDLLSVKLVLNLKFTSTEQSCIFIVPFRVYLVLNHLYSSAA